MPFPRPTVLTPPLGHRAIGLELGASLVLPSCGREVTGPDGVRLSRVLAIQPEFKGAPEQPSVASGVEFSRVRLTLERLGGGIALDRTIGSPEAGRVGDDPPPLITSAGDTVFRGGPDTLLVLPAQPGTLPTPGVVRPVYVCPGSQATRLELFPGSANAQGGSPLTCTAQAFDGQGTLVSDARPVQHDRIAVTGALALGGTLNVGFFRGSVPVSTNSFTVLTGTGATSGTLAVP